MTVNEAAQNLDKFGLGEDQLHNNTHATRTMFLRASSRCLPQLNKCPICESANSCTRPLLSTLKYPHTLGVERKFSSNTAPDVGVNPLSAFSAVMRAAITCTYGHTAQCHTRTVIRPRSTTLRPHIKHQHAADSLALDRQQKQHHSTPNTQSNAESINLCARVACQRTLGGMGLAVLRSMGVSS